MKDRIIKYIETMTVQFLGDPKLEYVNHTLIESFLVFVYLAHGEERLWWGTAEDLEENLKYIEEREAKDEWNRLERDNIKEIDDNKRNARLI